MDPYERLRWVIGEGYAETTAQIEAEMLELPHVVEIVHVSGERHLFGPYETGWLAFADVESRRAKFLRDGEAEEWTILMHSLYGCCDPNPWPPTEAG